GDEPTAFAWMSLGSYGRRESAPSSDLDSAVAWEGEEAPALALARTIVDDLDGLGFAADEHAANASHPLFARPVPDWRASIAQWPAHPGEENVLTGISLLADGRVVACHGRPAPVLDVLADSRGHPMLMRLLQRVAVTYRPPTGFLRDIVVEHSGEHRGHFNIK